ncbi:MAG: DUF4276 family protein [Candidatus Brocadiae bacterium]|nr:DUF4276 family protein [Candidatus Brocadiia bacterium]
MIRLNFVVEGQTEETFVRDVLGPHLSNTGVICSVRCVETGRKRGQVFRGGMISYAKFHRDLTLWMRQDQGQDAHFTTMLDLYRLPGDFPGYDDARALPDALGRAALLEELFCADVSHHRGQFIPYIQPFEFEALLFSDPQVFLRRFPNGGCRVGELSTVRASFPSPEHINDDEPPSKRILAVFPDYDKRADGPIIAVEIGLDPVRRQCAHFDEWLRRLEQLGEEDCLG